MSNSPIPGLFTTVAFNPALLRKEDLVRGFVARQDLLQRLLDDLRRAEPASPPQHQLIIGQRGLGKTTLLRRLAFAIEDDPQLAALWLPLVFPEEQYNVKRLGDFWLNCVDALSDALDRAGDKEAAGRLDRKVENIPSDPRRHSDAALAVLTEEAQRLGRKLVLLVDNVDIVFDRISDEEEWEFRRVISSEHRLYLIGASSRALETLYEHGRAFYDYFQVHDLKGLSDPEMFSLLHKLASEAGDERVQQILKEQPARLRALRVLTGGNPRTMLLLYRVLSEGPQGDVQRDIEQLLDLYTPLYKARFEEMSPQAQQLVDVMAIHWDPVTAAELTEKLKPLEVNQVSAQLKRLEDYGVVEKTPWFGESKAAFQISERFFNIWYLMRASRRVRRRLIWLVRFLEAWFEREEIAEHAREYLQRDPLAVGASRFAETTLAYAQLVDDRRLRRSLEAAGLRAALDVSVRDQFDFSDLPIELQDRKDRMDKLLALRSIVLVQQFEDVDNQQFWLLLGGSPQLTLEEKIKIVDELPTLSSVDAQHLLAGLKSSRLRLEEAAPSDVSVLYEIIRDGEVRDVYDVEGLLAVSDRRNLPSLPFAALTSGTHPALLSADLSTEQLVIAEQAWRRLASEPAYAAVATCELGCLFESHMQNIEKAELLFRQATKLDPPYAVSWERLAKVLRDQGKDDEAEQAYRHAIQIDPEYEPAWNGLGWLLKWRLGRNDDAEQAFRRAITINPKSDSAWLSLGMLFMETGRDEEAEQTIRRAIEIKADYAPAWVGLGWLLVNRLGGHDEAEEAFRRATVIDRKSKEAWTCLGLLLSEKSGRNEEAEQAFRRAIEIEPASDVFWQHLAWFLSKDDKRQAEALSGYVKAAELNSSDNETREEALRLAFFLFNRSDNDTQAALAAVQSLHVKFPEDPKVSFVLAELLTLQLKWPQAKKVLTELVDRGLDTPALRTFEVIVNSGHLNQAIAWFEESDAKELWRPVYEALRAIQAGSRQYLRRVAPEVRTVAEGVLAAIAPGLPNATRSRKPAPRKRPKTQTRTPQ